jgi:hypothetical protein
MKWMEKLALNAVENFYFHLDLWYFRSFGSARGKTQLVISHPIKKSVNLQWITLRFSGPVPVLVMSLLFIASVFMLHIWGKYTRS